MGALGRERLAKERKSQRGCGGEDVQRVFSSWTSPSGSRCDRRLNSKKDTCVSLWRPFCELGFSNNYSTFFWLGLLETSWHELLGSCRLASAGSSLPPSRVCCQSLDATTAFMSTKRGRSSVHSLWRWRKPCRYHGTNEAEVTRSA